MSSCQSVVGDVRVWGRRRGDVVTHGSPQVTVTHRKEVLGYLWENYDN